MAEIKLPIQTNGFANASPIIPSMLIALAEETNTKQNIKPTINPFLILVFFNIFLIFNLIFFKNIFNKN